MRSLYDGIVERYLATPEGDAVALKALFLYFKAQVPDSKPDYAAVWDRAFLTVVALQDAAEQARSTPAAAPVAPLAKCPKGHNLTGTFCYNCYAGTP